MRVGWRTIARTNSRIVKVSQTSLIRSSVISGVASVIPIPFLDDILLRKIRKGLVHRVLRDNEIGIDPLEFKPFYSGEPKGCVATALGLVFSLIRKVLKKLFRTVFFVFAVRASGVEMMETYLLGRTIDRKISEGVIHDAPSVGALAAPMRVAFKSALEGSDRKIFLQSMRQVWQAVADDKGAARTLIRKLRNKEESESPDEIGPEDLGVEEEAIIEKSRGVFERSLKHPDVQAFLRDFDVRFDVALARQL